MAQNIDKFSKDWWNTFLERTGDLSKTSVFKNCLDTETTLRFRKYVLQIVQSLAKLRTDQYGYRVYIDGKKLLNDEMNAIYDACPLDDDTIESWSKRVFKDKKFGIILNVGEKFNPSLSKEIALLVEPYLEIIGFPRDGINFSIFIGDYDKTPLGIHQDPPGQDVMHFHLGPGDKTMYTWGRQQYEDLTINTGYDKQDLQKLLPLSQEFTFGEGDMYFMPEGEYHIGKQDGLSVAITFWRYNHNESIFLKRLQQILFNQYFTDNSTLLEQDKNSLDDTSSINNILKNIQLPNDLENLTYKELLKETYSDLRYSIHSNAGYRSAMFPIKEQITLKKDDVIQLEKPFKILYKESRSKEKLYVFVRGTKLEFNNFNEIKNIINEINIGKPLAISNLLLLLPKDWDPETGIYILSLLYKKHGIIIKSTNS